MYNTEKRYQDGKDSKCSLHKGTQRRSGKDDNRRWNDTIGGCTYIIDPQVNNNLLDKGREKG